MLVNAEVFYNNINIHYINKDGVVEQFQDRIPDEEMFNWVYCKEKDGVSRSWDDKPIRKEEVKKINKYRLHEYLLTSLDPTVKELIFAKNQPKRFYCDIETEVLDEFPDWKNPKSKIQTIAFCNENNKIIVFGIKPLSDKQISDISDDINDYFKKFNKNINFSYQFFDNEETMLYTFLFKIIPKMASLTGWNFIDFDWNYIIARCELYNFDMSKAFGNEQQPFFYGTKIPKNMIITDYLQLFKVYDTTISVKENYKLDWVGDAVLGLKKIKYDGDLTKLYINDFQKYVLYNAVDTFLVKMIDELTDCMSVHLSLSHITKVNIQKTFSTIPLAENVLQERFLEDDKHFVANDGNKKDTRVLPGGYVTTPIKDLYTDICVLDFSSLYPTIMRQFNISPETYMGKESDFDSDTIKKNIKTANGSIFKKEPGILPDIIENIYKNRKIIQKKSLVLDKEMEMVKKEMSKRVKNG